MSGRNSRERNHPRHTMGSFCQVHATRLMFCVGWVVEVPSETRPFCRIAGEKLGASEECRNFA